MEKCTEALFDEWAKEETFVIELERKGERLNFEVEMHIALP